MRPSMPSSTGRIAGIGSGKGSGTGISTTIGGIGSNNNKPTTNLFSSSVSSFMNHNHDPKHQRYDDYNSNIHNIEEQEEREETTTMMSWSATRSAEQLETELSEMRRAFQEYVTTTQDLEIGLDTELQDMQGKLDESATAYETLAEKLKNMEPMLRKLELSLDGTKKRLKEEAKARRTAEVAQIEAETRCQEAETINRTLREENIVFREECETLHAEFSHKCKENERLKREQEANRRQLEQLSRSRLGSSIQSRRDDHTSEASPLMNVDSGVITEMASNKTNTQSTAGEDSYAEVLDELETVTEQLISTQQKLWLTEDQLRESEGRALEIENNLRNLKSQKQATKGARELEQIRAELEATKKELEQSEAGLVKERVFEEQQESELHKQDDQIEFLREQIDEMEESAKLTQEQLSQYEELLEESQEENARLVEEIACLRDILHDENNKQETEANVKESISKEVRAQVLKEANEVREKEINALREQFKKIFKENTLLKEKLDKLESGNPTSLLDNGDSKLKKQVEQLNDELQKAQDDHRTALLEIETSWKKKLEQVMTGEFIPEDLLEEMEEEMKNAIDSAANRVRILQEEKEELEERVENMERELEFSETRIHISNQRFQETEGNLRASRDEILRLKKSNTHLTSELEYTSKIMARMDAECERLTRQQSELKAELEVALSVIEAGGMDSSTIHTEETMKAKEKAYRLTTNLNKLKGDYATLLGELEKTRQQFLDSHEEATKKNEADMMLLSKKNNELEEALEKAKFEQENIAKKLEAMKRTRDEAESRQEAKISKAIQEELDVAGGNISKLEKELKESLSHLKPLQRELKQCKDALSSSRIENKRLEEEMEKMKSDGLTTRSRSSRDPDPHDNYGIMDFTLFKSRSRDPPSKLPHRESQQVVGRDLEGDMGHLYSRLDDLALENDVLKEKITRMGGECSRPPFDSEELMNTEKKLLEAQILLQATEEKMIEAENKAGQTDEECIELRSEISALKEALREARQNHSDTLHELERMKRQNREIAEELKSQRALSNAETKDDFAPERASVIGKLEVHVQKLTDEKSSLQHQVDDSKIALSVSQYAQERSKEELRLCQSKLDSSNKKVRVMKEELAKLTKVFSKLKDEHEKLLADYDNTGENTPDTDRLTAQLQKVATENSSLQKVVSQLERDLSNSQEEVETKKKEIDSLQCSLLTTQEETRLLSKEISNLTSAFEKAQAEYDAVVDELDAVQVVFEKSSAVEERNGKESASDEPCIKLNTEKEKQKQYMAEQLEKAFAANLDLQKRLDDVETSLLEAKKNSYRDNRTLELQKETEILQMALQDSQNEVKILKERCFELEVLFKKASSELGKARDESGSSKPDPIVNEMVLSAVFDSPEMQDLKEQFNALIEENINLEQVVRESELALTLAKDVEERNKEDISNLQEEISDLKATKLKLQEEVYNLTVELERANDDHHIILEETRTSIEEKAAAKAKSLQNQIDALTIKNSSLQGRIRKYLSTESAFDSPSKKDMKETSSIENEYSEAKPANFQSGTISTEDNSESGLLQLEDIYKDRDQDSSTFNAELLELKNEHDTTMEVLERVNSLLASVDFLERHHEINLRTSHSHFLTTSQKAEEIRRKVAFLTYALQKSKKEHSDVLLQLKAGKKQTTELVTNLESGRHNSEYEALQKQKQELEEKLDATELTLKTARESEERHKIEVEVSEKKYLESQKAASYFKEQVLYLQEMLHNSKEDYNYLKEQMETANERVADLIKNAEERGKSAAMAEVRKSRKEEDNSEELTSMYQQIYQENEELHLRLEETEAALSAARDMKKRNEEEMNVLELETSAVDKLDSSNQRLSMEFHNLKNNLDNAKNNREAVRQELEFVRQKLEYCNQSPQKQAELGLLREQFKKLSGQSITLAQQVKVAEEAVAVVRDQQKKLKDDAKARAFLATELQHQIDKIVEETKQRNQEISELTILMENRVNLTEESVDKLEQELSATSRSFLVSKAGLFVSMSQESNERVARMVLDNHSDLFQSKDCTDGEDGNDAYNLKISDETALSSNQSTTASSVVALTDSSSTGAVITPSQQAFATTHTNHSDNGMSLETLSSSKDIKNSSFDDSSKRIKKSFLKNLYAGTQWSVGSSSEEEDEKETVDDDTREKEELKKDDANTTGTNADYHEDPGSIATNFGSDTISSNTTTIDTNGNRPDINDNIKNNEETNHEHDERNNTKNGNYDLSRNDEEEILTMLESRDGDCDDTEQRE